MQSNSRSRSSRGRILRGHAAKGEAPAASPSSEVAGRGPEERSRILIVDDEPANVMILERLLQRVGSYEIASTTDPLAGLNLVDAFAPDLVLLDLHMPGIDGCDFMERIPERIGERLAAKGSMRTAAAPP